MKFINLINLVSNKTMNIFSSIFVGAKLDAGNLFSSLTNPDSIIGKILSFLFQLIYFACKWAMYIIDVLFFYVQQLAGMTTDTSSLEAITSKSSDMVFNLLISNKDRVIVIIKNLAGLAIVLIIIVTIIAIIKQQFSSLNQKGSSNNVTILRSMMKAFVLLIITPILAIIGIVASNVLLQSLYRATNTSSTDSLSARIFEISASSANKYRRYATSGVRIPITFDFSASDEIIAYYKNNTVTEGLEDYLSADSNPIYVTCKMFGDKSYYNYDQFWATYPDYKNAAGVFDEDKYNKFLQDYYVYFDHSSKAKFGSEDSYSVFNTIRSYAEEYYVMADVIEFAMGSMDPMYFMTIQELLDSIVKIDDPDLSKQIYDQIAGTYNISLCDSGGNVLITSSPTTSSYDEYVLYNWNYIMYTSDYYVFDGKDYSSGVGSSTDKKTFVYYHKKNSLDEAEGAKYIVCALTKTPGDVSSNYYTPIVLGFESASGQTFEANSVVRGQLISAKGIFDSNSYPTAIKKSIAYGDITFYRDNLEAISLGKSNGLATSSVKESDSAGGFAGAIKSVFSFVKKLFNPASLVPDLELNPGAMAQSYTKTSTNVFVLGEGKVHISYFFADKFTSSISKSLYGLNLYNLFEPLSINYMILVLGTAIFLKVCFLAIFGLMNRSFDIFMLFMIYPAACATIPIDDYNMENGGKKRKNFGIGYDLWRKRYIAKLFSAYGLILGINFVLLLFPVIESIEFFSEASVAASKTILRVGNFFLGGDPTKISGFIRIATKCLNLLVTVLFELVAFSIITPASKKGKGASDIVSSISNIVGGDPGVMENNLGAKMYEMMRNVAKGVQFVFGTPRMQMKIITDKFKSVVAGAIEFLPGSTIIKKAGEKKQAMEAQKQKEGEEDKSSETK